MESDLNNISLEELIDIYNQLDDFIKYLDKEDKSITVGEDNE